MGRGGDSACWDVEEGGGQGVENRWRGKGLDKCDEVGRYASQQARTSTRVHIE